MSFMYMIAGYTGYSYMDDNGGNDDVMNGHALLGTASLFALLAVVLEIVLGFVGMGNHQLWSFAFMFMAFCATVFQLASASLLAQGYGDAYDGTKSVDNIKASGFFLFAAPMTIWILIFCLKYFDFRASSNGETPA